MKKIGVFIVGMLLMCSCGKEIPGNIIQPEKMETVLYDYHLGLSLKQETNSSDASRREAYKEYVFKKHQITSAEFDSSMVWYTREAMELTAIYQNLEKRFKREHEHAKMLMNSRNMNNRMTQSGDTVDVWNKNSIQWLTEGPLANQLFFEIKADTTFHEMDIFQWSADYTFLASGKAILGMNVIYENDSVVGETKHFNESGKQTICLQVDSAWKIKELNGFIEVSQDSINEPVNLLVHNIALMRYHMKSDSIAVTDSIIKDKDINLPKEEKPATREDKLKTRSKATKE